MIDQAKLETGTLIRIVNNGPYTLEKYQNKYLLVKKVTTDKFGAVGVYNDVYYLDGANNTLVLEETNDIFVGFIWASNLNKIRYAAKVVDQLGEQSIGAKEIPFNDDKY